MGGGIEENIITWSNQRYLIVTIGAVALAGIFVPTAVLSGLAVGGGNYIITKISIFIIEKMNWIKKDTNSEYGKFIVMYPLYVTLIGPVLEEWAFRGSIQPLIASLVFDAIPATDAAFLGTNVSVAIAVSIVATSILFGVMHLENKHTAANVQAVLAGIQGVTLGICAVQLGLVAAIAAHVANNTIVLARG